MGVKIIGFDLYSTLINADNPDWESMMSAVHAYLVQKLSYNGSFKQFLEIRNTIYQKWRRYREEKCVELNSDIWWKEILEALNVQFKMMDIQQIKRVSHSVWRTQIKLYPKVKDLLFDLRKNYTVVCISNISDGNLAREDMEHFGILDLFDYVLMSSDLGIRKPSPKIFQHVLDHFEIKNNEMIFVGDTLYDDVQGAKAANLRLAIHIKRSRSYFFPEYYIEPDKTIYSLHEIVDVLKFLD